MEHVPAPDFPTGGIPSTGSTGCATRYRTGRGSVQIRARAFIEKGEEGDRESIVVTEIPYQVNKFRLIERMAELVRNKEIEEISDLRDEFDRDGMRAGRGAEEGRGRRGRPQQPVQADADADLLRRAAELAIVQNRPRTMNLKELLEEFLAFGRRSSPGGPLFLLRKAEARSTSCSG